MKVIYAAAGLFVLLALWAFWLAIQLIPTDLGNSYMVAASVMFSTAGLLTGIGLVGQKIVDAVAMSVPLPALPPRQPAEPEIAPPAPVSPAPPAFEPEAPPAPSVPGLSVPGSIVAGAAAGVVAGAALGGLTKRGDDAASDLDLLNDLERDLLAELKAEPLKDDAAAEAAPSLPPLPVESPWMGEPEDAALPAPSARAAADTGEDDDLMLPPLPPLPHFSFEPAPTPPVMEAESRAIADAAHDDDDIDDRAEAVPVSEPEEPVELPAVEPEPEPVASSTPGLIHDEDLARLAEAEADLAPLDTLDVVGAYDSGGTRFTMYSDGSVTAKGEGVDRRFRSLDDLRAFIDGGMRG